MELVDVMGHSSDSESDRTSLECSGKGRTAWTTGGSAVVEVVVVVVDVVDVRLLSCRRLRYACTGEIGMVRELMDESELLRRSKMSLASMEGSSLRLASIADGSSSSSSREQHENKSSRCGVVMPVQHYSDKCRHQQGWRVLFF